MDKSFTVGEADSTRDRYVYGTLKDRMVEAVRDSFYTCIETDDSAVDVFTSVDRSSGKGYLVVSWHCPHGGSFGLTKNDFPSPESPEFGKALEAMTEEIRVGTDNETANSFQEDPPCYLQFEDVY